MRVGGAQVFMRIDWRVVDADFVVEVGSCAAAGIADVADGVSAMHVLAGKDCKALHVTIACGNAMTVIEHNSASISAHEIGEDHSSVCRRDDLLPDRRPNINS